MIGKKIFAYHTFDNGPICKISKEPIQVNKKKRLQIKNQKTKQKNDRRATKKTHR